MLTGLRYAKTRRQAERVRSASALAIHFYRAGQAEHQSRRVRRILPIGERTLPANISRKTVSTFRDPPLLYNRLSHSCGEAAGCLHISAVLWAAVLLCLGVLAAISGSTWFANGGVERRVRTGRDSFSSGGVE